MDLLNGIFTYLPAHHIAVCKAHRQGVLSSQVQTHLDSSHRDLTTASRRAITSVATALTEWAASPEEVLYPPPEAQPLACLPLHKDGLRCTARACAYVARGLQNMQSHCKKEHGWSNSRKRGRPHQGACRLPGDLMWTAGVWCQKFQPTGQLGRLFEVGQPCSDSRGLQGATSEEGALQHALEASFAQSASAVEEAHRSAHNQIQQDDDRFVWHQWLRRTQWARHLAGFDRAWLQQQLRRPSEEEGALEKVCWAVETVIWRAQQASSPEAVGLPAALFVERRETGAADSEKPFNALQTGKTMARYCRYWVSAICYLWRTHDLPEATDRTESTGSRKPPYRLTAKQTHALWQVRQTVSATRRRERTERNSACSSEDLSNSDPDGENELDEEQEQELEARVLALLISLLDHQLADSYYRSALVSATAVLGVDRDRSWKSPLVYTTVLSAFVTVSKMLVLYSAVQARKRQIAELREAEGWSQEDAEDIADSHFERVQDMATRFMTLTAFGGAPTPIDWMLRLRAYGKKIRGDTNAAGVVQWVGDTIMYGYVQYSMVQLRSMVHGLVEATRVELHRDLLLLDVDDAGRLADDAAPLPPVEWDKVADNPAELRAGWSFLQDPRNTLGGVKGDGWLARRVTNEERLRSAFVDREASDLSLGGCGVVWAAKRVQQYEKALRLFREHLLVAVHMTGGQPARGTELVTVTYRNMPNGQSRGVFVEDGLMVYVTMYHKGIGQAGTAKVIHRHLPQEVGELLFYYLWLVLPFWQKLERASGRVVDGEPSPFIWEPVREEQWAGPQRRKKQRLHQSRNAVAHGQDESEDDSEGDNEDNSFQHNYLQEKRAPTRAARRAEQWGTNQVRRAIERVSLRWLKTKLNIQIWRHNTKATIRQYIKDEVALRTPGWADGEAADQEAEDDAFDLQSGHGSRTAGQIYGRPADESPFSIQAKRAAFRRVSVAWHRFLQFESALSAKPQHSSTAIAASNGSLVETASALAADVEH